MRITVQFTGLFKALAGIDRDLVDVAEGTTIDGLARTLGRQYDKLQMESELTFFVVNDRVSQRDHILADGDQVRIFQTLAGG